MISQSRYINTTSGVGANTAVAQRQLIMRLITQNTLLPPGIVMEASNADSVGAYFGVNSEEYKRAVRYFAFVSKSITAPALISFARWVNAPIAPLVIGDATTKNLAALKALNAGTMTINVDTTVVNVTGVSLTAAASLTAVAATLQTAIRATANSQLATANVTFNTNTNQFVLTGSTPGSGSITITPTGTASDISPLIGWGTSGTVYAPGQAADTADAAVAKSASISNNMGSIVFCTPATPLTGTDIQAVSAWNAAQNNMYIYSVAVTLAGVAALFALVKGNAGTALNILSATLPNDYIEQLPCEVLASTNYNKAGASQSYMWQISASRNTTVFDDPTADLADSNRANYIGVTQQAGQPLAFYQRGVLCGGPTAATDVGVYANESWFKSDVTARLFGIFVGLPEIPANADGRGKLIGSIQQSIDLAITNGTISSGKTLTDAQKQYITTISGDSNAWRQIAGIGYWLSVDFESYTNQQNQLTEWRAVYTLIYSKKDDIRVVNGSDVLI